MTFVSYHIVGIVNLSILVFLLVYLWRKPIKNFFRLRKENLLGRRNWARKFLSEKEREYKDYYGKLENINGEMKKIMDLAEKEGERTGEKMLKEAEVHADNIINRSLARTDSEVRKKNKEFYQSVVQASLHGAEKTIKSKITKKIDVSLGKTFLKKLAKEGDSRG